MSDDEKTGGVFVRVFVFRFLVGSLVDSVSAFPDWWSSAFPDWCGRLFPTGRVFPTGGVSPTGVVGFSGRLLPTGLSVP